MAGLKRAGILLIIFLGPGSIIYFISKTFENHFVRLPYIGTTYEEDSTGNIVDSTLYTIGDFNLTTFDGLPINRDSIEDKIIILTTLQNECPKQSDCGLGVYLFNEIMFDQIVENRKNYYNVKVISVLTDLDGNPVSEPSEYLSENMKEYDQDIWWMCTGDPTPFYSFDYYGDKFMNHPSTPEAKEIGSKAFINSFVLIDAKGHIRGVSGARKDSDIRNFFDMLKLLKKEEFDHNRKQEEK